MANRWGNNGNSDRLYFLGLQKHCRWWLQPWNKKTLALWKKSYDKPRQYIKKQIHHFVDKSPFSQSYGSSSYPMECKDPDTRWPHFVFRVGSFSVHLHPCAAILEKAMVPYSSTLAWKIPWMEEPGRLQFMGSLRVGYDWETSLSLSCIGEGNGSPLQYSCLESPRDRGAWWAAVYGVAQSRTRLKWLSSSSSCYILQNYLLPMHSYHIKA